MTSETAGGAGPPEEPDSVESAPQVFLSYRRADTQDVAVMLSDRLRGDLGSRNVFRDNEDLIAGQKWAETLTIAIDDSDAVVIILGPDWEGVKDDGTRRIDEERDPVRNEVERTLNDKTQPEAVPVLIDLDDPPEIPEALEPLLDRHFVRASSESLADPKNRAYQQILVGVWESLRAHHPRGVLIIGEEDAHGSLDELVNTLKESNAIDASKLSRFAAGAYLVTARRARKGAHKWPDVIFVAEDDSPSDILRARIEAAYQSNTIRRVAVVGAGAAALLALVAEGAFATTAAASATSVATYTATAELAAATPTAGSGLIGSATTAWSNTAMGAKVAIAAGAVAVSGAAVATVVTATGDSSVPVDFAASTTVAPFIDDDRSYPLGTPDDAIVTLGDPVATGDTGEFSPNEDMSFVEREVTLSLSGQPPILLGPVTLPEALSADWIEREGDGTFLIGNVFQEVRLPSNAVPLADFCFDEDDPSIVVSGWTLNGDEVELEVDFLVTIEDGSVTGFANDVFLEGPSTREDLSSFEPDMDMTDCPVNIQGSADWAS